MRKLLEALTIFAVWYFFCGLIYLYFYGITRLLAKL